MTRKAHRDNELKPPADALVALDQWLNDNGLRRVALAQPMGTPQAQVSRMFAGSAYLSAAHRQAIEKLTEGAITAAMLEGKVPPPTKAGARRSAPVAVPPEPVASRQTPDDAERIVDSLAAKAMPAAFKVIIEQMVKGKTESERRRCAEILIEHLRGKAKQYEKREQLVQPVSDEALLRKLREIEANLTGLPVDEYGRVIRPPQVKAPKDPA
jgi:DNA-binding transcriptional regulator YdaS (Cro superfamily)